MAPVSSAARNPGSKKSLTAHQWRLLAFGVILSALAFVLFITGPFPHTAIQIATFGSALAFAVFAYSEAISWRDPLTEGHSLVLVIWTGIAFPAYLLTTTSRRPFWLTLLLLLFLSVNVAVGLFASSVI